MVETIFALISPWLLALKKSVRGRLKIKKIAESLNYDQNYYLYKNKPLIPLTQATAKPFLKICLIKIKVRIQKIL